MEMRCRKRSPLPHLPGTTVFSNPRLTMMGSRMTTNSTKKRGKALLKQERHHLHISSGDSRLAMRVRHGFTICLRKKASWGQEKDHNRVKCLRECRRGMRDKEIEWVAANFQCVISNFSINFQ